MITFVIFTIVVFAVLVLLVSALIAGGVTVLAAFGDFIVFGLIMYLIYKIIKKCKK